MDVWIDSDSPSEFTVKSPLKNNKSSSFKNEWDFN